MSRSRKHTPICGMSTAASDKLFKRSANRRLRRLVREAILAEGSTDLELRDVSDAWNSAKDGKQYCPDPHARILRK